MIEVVAAVIQQGGLYLVARRPAHKHHDGLWKIPGGKRLPEESPEAVTRRELQEELDLNEIQVLHHIRTLKSDDIRLHFIALR